MGHRIPDGEEQAALRDLITQARQAAKDLRTTIKEAKGLTAALVSDYERTHANEIKQLSNFLTEESNRHAASLNADVERARKMISEQIMSGKAVFDRETSTVTISWGDGAFDANQPLPYPSVPIKETSK